MYNIEEKECFANCTQLCKPHESNKAFWNINNNYNEREDKEAYTESLLLQKIEIEKKIKHSEFI